MKTLLTKMALLCAISASAQIPSYYNNVNLNVSGQSLKNTLANKISSQTSSVSYTPGVWNGLRQTDLDPNNSANVILVYGYNDNDGNSSTDRTRSKYDNGGGSKDWNREHIFPKSLGTPSFGNSGPGTDLHHIRPSDINRNASRGNRKFADGAGNSKITSQGYWYPGDEFKGDVARMVMYMYLRYNTRCQPKNVGIGSTVANDSRMIDLFLEWNAEDPVSPLELQRNNAVENIQGNRNPFIDNPAFATQIWGGQQAEDRFNTGGGNTGGGNTGGGNTGTTTVDVRLTLTFDNYAGETSWEIRNNSNQVVFSGGNYGNQSSGSTIQINKTLDAGCYTLTIKDSYGDGMCCNYGNGSFVFWNLETGNMITSGGSFNSSKTKAFCVGTNARSASVNDQEVIETKVAQEKWTIYPNPVGDVLQLKGKTFQGERYQIINTTGQIVKTGILERGVISLDKLETGVYFLQISTKDQPWVERFVKQF